MSHIPSKILNSMGRRLAQIKTDAILSKNRGLYLMIASNPAKAGLPSGTLKSLQSIFI
jgi:hypothetical protein